jgi:hypothetical protein
VSYWLGTDTPPAKLRANIILYFAASTVLSLASSLWGGLFSAQIFQIALFAGREYGLGTFLGKRVFGLASPRLFRNASLGLITLEIALSEPPFPA